MIRLLARLLVLATLAVAVAVTVASTRPASSGVLAASPAADVCAGPEVTAESTHATPPAATPTNATPPPLDAGTLDRLVIADAPISSSPFFVQNRFAVQPGQVRPLALGALDDAGFNFIEPVTAVVTWSVAPDDCVAIDPATGVLTVAPDAPHGYVFTVTADVEDGRRAIAVAVHVFTPEANPLVGLWREEARLACDGGTELATAEPVEELVFNADGTFTVTWTPFETYVDYWGTYTYDLAAGTLELTVDSGNQIPADIDGIGRFALADGDLVLTELWLGSPEWGTEPAACGHRFG